MMTIRVAISMGDPAGIGPEVILGALARPVAGVRLVVFGKLEVFRHTAWLLGCSLPTTGVDWVEIPGAAATSVLAPAGRAADREVLAGRLQVQALERAVEAVLAGSADALCTAPICKEAAAAAGFPHPGHTEYLAASAGSKRWAMMLAGPGLRVVPLTGHRALREVSSALEVPLVAQTIELTVEGLRGDFGIAVPRVALTGLNPHAGEGGLLGEEEHRILVPGLESARGRLARRGLEAHLVGPLSADGLFAGGLFAGGAEQHFDAVVCCYHDQALIPFKMRHRDDGVNVTLGLPFVRTSPAHGTAFDIAGRGLARSDSMIAAIAMAVAIARRRRAPDLESGVSR